jgi:NAD(P)-dependent dehydrogenase (short-subunit alcohol dehydrogenase family)
MKHRSGGTAVITGAGSGFGLEASRIAAQRGMAVVMVDVQADALATAAAEMEALGVPVLAQRVDVASATQMQALAEQVLQRFGAPHFVFNNAGVGAGGLVWENTVKDWDWVMGVDLMGVVHGIRLFTPAMLAAAKADAGYRGHIVNTASMAGLLNAPNMGIYNAAKAAVVAISETLYQDLALVTEQVHAHLLCPYFVPTGINSSERNRPSELSDAGAKPSRSQLIAQAMTKKAVGSGKVSAAQVAQFVFEAMDERRFWVFSHPRALGNVQSRMESILQIQNPADPFKGKPEIGEELRKALRDEAL